jgi:hypothetical protein
MEIRLPKNETVKIEGDPRGMVLRCREGVVWLTQAGDSRDYFLKAGEMVCFRYNGTAVLEGHEDATVTIARAETSRVPHQAPAGAGIRLVFQGSGR